MSVVGDLRAEFARSGPIRFDRFMERVLYGEGGFFASSPDRAGLLGDFVTSVELGPVFGAVLARRLLRWSKGRPHVATPWPNPIRVADVGGGRGTLARQLESAGRGGIEALVVDRAEGGAGVAGLDELPWRPDVVVAHELLDNLPARLLHKGEAEVRVGFDDAGAPCLFHVPLDSELAAFAARWPVEGGAGVAPVPTGALAWSTQVAALDPALVIVVDYGADFADLARREDWPVRGYAGQSEVDPIAAPGETDVTCDVPFDVVEAALAEHGFRSGRVRQRDWLERNGLEDVVAAAGSADAPTGLGRLRASEARTQAAELRDPSGLGDFWVLEATREPHVGGRE